MKRTLFAILFVSLVAAASLALDRANKPTPAQPSISDTDIAAARAVVAQGVPGGSGLASDRENVARYYGAIDLLARAFDPCHGNALPSHCCLDRARWWICSTTEDALPLRLCASLPATEPSCEDEPSNPEYQRHRGTSGAP
jgi:hypothetical protein